MKNFVLALLLVLGCAFGYSQQPQTQTAPIYAVNSKYANGVAPGYAPTSGTGLTLNLSGGTANCSGVIEQYSAGSLSLTASSTNYIYLNTSASCVPAVKTNSFTSSDIPIATVVTGISSITSIVDDRTFFSNGGSSPSGVTSITPGTNTTCTPNVGGSCTGGVSISATGGGGGLIPSNANFVFTGSSINDDDNKAIETVAIPISTITCNGTSCTVVTTSAHGLSANQWVNMRFSTADFAAFNAHLPSTVALETGGTVFKVLSTGLTLTQFEFNYTLASPTCSSSCGNAYLANFNLPFNTTSQGALKGIGNTVMIIPNPVSIAGLATNYTAILHSISPAITGIPGYLIINGLTNDFASSSCSSSSIPTLETNLQTIWNDAHNDGWVVIMGSPIATLVNEFGSSCLQFYPYLISLEQWLYRQGPTVANMSTGQFWDRFSDIERVVNDGHDSSLVASNAGALGPIGADLAASVIARTITNNSSMSYQKNGDYFSLPMGNYGGLGSAAGRMFIPYTDTISSFGFTNAAMSLCVLCINTTNTSNVTISGQLFQTWSGDTTQPTFVSSQNSGSGPFTADWQFIHHITVFQGNISLNSPRMNISSDTGSNGGFDFGWSNNALDSATQNFAFLHVQGDSFDSFHAVTGGQFCVYLTAVESNGQKVCPTANPFSVGTAGQFNVDINGNATGNSLRISATYTVSTLPTCSGTNKGQQTVVTDASSPTYLGALTGSGAVYAPVICNGTIWVSY